MHLGALECADRLPVRAGLKAGRYSLRDHLRCPDGFEFLGRDVKLNPPATQVRTFFRKCGVEEKVGVGQLLAQASKFRLWRKPVQLKQVSQATDDGSDSEPRRIIDQPCDDDVIVPHPESLRHFANASTIFRLAQSVDDSAFQVADLHRFLFGDPVFDGSKIPPLLSENG